MHCGTCLKANYSHLIKVLLYGCFFICFCCSRSFGQDIQLTQFYESPATLSPASSGATQGYRYYSGTRFRGINENAPNFTSFGAFDITLLQNQKKKNTLGLGLVVLNNVLDETGRSHTMFNISASVHFQINRYNTIGFGTQPEFARRINPLDPLKKGLIINDIFPFIKEKENPQSYFSDNSSALYWNYTGKKKIQANAGVVLFHLKTPAKKFRTMYDESMLLSIFTHGSFEYLIDETNMAINPFYMTIWRDGKMSAGGGGLIKIYLRENSLYTGLVTASSIAFGVSTFSGEIISIINRYEMSNHWTVGISADFKVRGGGRNGGEILLSYRGLFKRGRGHLI
jgi:hypothetical protein